MKWAKTSQTTQNKIKWAKRRPNPSKNNPRLTKTSQKIPEASQNESKRETLNNPKWPKTSRNDQKNGQNNPKQAKDVQK